MSVLHDIEPCRPAPDILEEMIHASGAKSADQLTIAGGGYLDLLIGLCRRGFACVSCHAADRGPPAGEAASDVLWIPEVKSEAQLLTVIAGLGRNLRPDGILLIRQQRQFPAGRLRRLASLLAERGFVLEKQTATASGGTIFCARKRLFDQVRYAA